MPLTDQVNAVFEALDAVAVNCWACPVSTVAVVGVIETLTGGGGLFDEPPHATTQTKHEVTISIRT